MRFVAASGGRRVLAEWALDDLDALVDAGAQRDELLERNAALAGP